jgi:hypothetical protein
MLYLVFQKLGILCACLKSHVSVYIYQRRFSPFMCSINWCSSANQDVVAMSVFGCLRRKYHTYSAELLSSRIFRV